MTPNEMTEKLADFFGINSNDGTYWHILTRVKDSRYVGTMTIDDFVEIDMEIISDLAEFITNIIASEYE